MSAAEIGRLTQEVNALLRAGQLMNAVAPLYKISKLAPSWADGFVQLGTVLHNLERFDEASQAFASAVKLVPDNAAVHGLLGRSLFAARKFEAGEAALRQALRVDPKSLESLVVLATNLVSQSRLVEAERLTNHAFAMNPTWLPGVYYSGVVRYRQKRFQDAHLFFWQMTKQAPAMKEATLFLARTIGNLGQVEAAVALLRAAANQHPGFNRMADRMSWSLRPADLLAAME